jgi:predicted transcriptional regulator
VLGLGPFADDELSAAQYVARGDEICADAHDDFTKLQESAPRTSSEAVELTDELVGISRDELDAVSELTPPPDLKPAMDRYLKARESGIELMRDGLAAAEDGDAFNYSKAQADLASSQLDRRDLAEKVGFSECSQPIFGKDELASDSEAPVNTDPSAPPTVANPPTGTP